MSKAEVDQKMVEARRREIEAEQQYEKWLAKKVKNLISYSFVSYWTISRNGVILVFI